jgi:hypothetical protein
MVAEAEGEPSILIVTSRIGENRPRENSPQQSTSQGSYTDRRTDHRPSASGIDEQLRMLGQAEEELELAAR